MTEPDAVMTRVGQGIEFIQRGDRDTGRRLFTELWEQIGPTQRPIPPLRDLTLEDDDQDDVRDGLNWDLRALEAADSLTNERAAEAGVTSQSPRCTRRCTSTSATANSAIPKKHESTAPWGEQPPKELEHVPLRIPTLKEARAIDRLERQHDLADPAESAVQLPDFLDHESR